MGPITWACLLLAVHQAPSQEFFLESRDFKIPIKIDPRRRNDLLELTLFVSRDRGSTWVTAAQACPLNWRAQGWYCRTFDSTY